ncbi:putative bifunctional diguanylate cyclase/phosphodiesterase [Sphingomonas ursincola]|uniref:putative bifunctional diguanylate cyclase/phosphodiesterase n=1 Tax=Sphingomonas ursincola TaxID=56361 RepID=UPI002354EDAB|nr:EAL domain-containing protein [Sphingomonas ursincola]MBY0618428.1 EAL domain-containing protein [Sphingomonas ursincola]
MSVQRDASEFRIGSSPVGEAEGQRLDRELAILQSRSLLQSGQLQELADLANFQREALDAAAIVAVTDRAGRITSVNAKFCELSGYSEAELIGANHRILASGGHDRAFFQNLYRTISRGNVWHDVICNRAKCGRLYWVDTTIVPHRDRSGYTAIRFDVTPQKEAEQRLWRLANIDPLTRLANRRRFLELMVTATCKGTPFATAILDIDHFKDINDSAGHHAGDQLLIAVGQALRAELGECDAIGRLGGDEFAVILHDEDGTHLQQRLDGILAALRRKPVAEMDDCTIHASIGAALFPRDGKDAASLLKSADLALYAAKQSGRGCARRFKPSYREAADQRAGLRTAITHAMERNELFILYQPIVNLVGGQPMAFEALLRWRRADGSIQTPATFGEVFEDEQIAAEIGNFVLTEVLGQIDRWKAEGVPFQWIAINATLGDFRARAFVDRIADAVESGRISGEQLCIEITEGMLLDRGARAVREAVDRLNALGVEIAFDDFGTGFASLTHLRQLPINHVKIDRSFIEAICVEGKDRVIVESVIDLAHRLGLKVVAEGVEQAAQARLLRRLECDSIQGFLIAPALTEALATDFVRRDIAC